MEAGANSQAKLYPAYLLLSRLTQSASLCFSGCPVQVWSAQSELDPSTGTSIKKINADFAQANLVGTFSQFRFTLT